MEYLRIQLYQNQCLDRNYDSDSNIFHARFFVVNMLIILLLGVLLEKNKNVWIRAIDPSPNFKFESFIVVLLIHSNFKIFHLFLKNYKKFISQDSVFELRIGNWVSTHIHSAWIPGICAFPLCVDTRSYAYSGVAWMVILKFFRRRW